MTRRNKRTNPTFGFLYLFKLPPTGFARSTGNSSGSSSSRSSSGCSSRSTGRRVRGRRGVNNSSREKPETQATTVVAVGGAAGVDVAVSVAAVCCLLIVDCCLLFVVCCLLFAVCCLWFAV